MRSLGTRRAALVAGAATVAALALGGCSAGQVAETAILDTPIAGVNAASESEAGKVLVRNLQVEYNGIEGYEANENAPLEVSLFNETNEAVTVTISSQPAANRPDVLTAKQVGFVSTATVTTPGEVASASAEPGASASPSASAEPASSVRPAQIKIGPQGSAVFRPTDAAQLQVVGLSGELKPGMTVNLVFEFSNNATPLVLQAPVASPLTPAPRGSAEIHEETEGGGH
ncbi:hypothetical protein [Actinoplanes xinjiangensis]|jgi:hypothetical protein|uniref:Copper(I)-binding protein n=1 Tax=Actinoplanes xinjiangensis TaxID=512350 RepID=A0A316FG09_9ACTN|nr:hypothetical protein [Actinoplanes xinjiangensis]PWK46646.1 hypothetical protein BC793_109215 [Actinoplanes xinjiangensis]GIF40531.1 hypothetical protein Axi01nite_48420 [Actinoplanes xinjiangensis]